MAAIADTPTLITAILGSNVITAVITGSLSRRTEADRCLLDQVKAAWTEVHKLKSEAEAQRHEVDMLRLEHEALRTTYAELHTHYCDLRAQHDQLRTAYDDLRKGFESISWQPPP
ncbi:MAG TPA: hypothetical protein VGK19_21265 [Capsulimonadaceae bacterium]|jgi:uncharacterized protein (DUF3084 family)